MCNRYVTPEQAEVERFWQLDKRKSNPWSGSLAVFPRAPGPFIRRARHDAGYERELVIGQWGLIPWFSEASTPRTKEGRPMSTNNARSEELAWKPSFKDPWKRGQRCVIPALSFDEPNWETGKNIWWQFSRADRDPWGLAGLWNVWTDKTTGEVHESYTMLTLNADNHALMSRMHRPVLDPKTKQPLPVDRQDKRSVIPIERGDVDQWLAGTLEDAKALLQLSPVEVFVAGPIVPPASLIEDA